MKTYDILNAGERNRFMVNGRIVSNCTGNGPQPTNMPRGSLSTRACTCGKHFVGERCPYCGGTDAGKPDEWTPDVMEEAIELLQTGSLEVIEHAYGKGKALELMAGCLRGMFIARDGYDLVSSDYTAIEAVVLACLAGEQWRIDLFKNKGKIYEASGAKIGGVPYEELLAYKAQTGKHHSLRAIGKVAELALGYGGWVGAWLAFDKANTRSEDELKKIILAWRDASPALVEFWGGQKRRNPWKDELFGVEGAFIQAALTPGVPVNYRGLVFEASASAFPVRVHAPTLVPACTVQITLLSGRKLTYHNVLLEPSDREWAGKYSISYEGFNSNPKMGAPGWTRLGTYGPKLVENIVQATANDILRYAMANLERAGYGIVLHVYDEIVCEVPQGWGSVEELETIMKTLPAWAAGWPIGADGGWRGKRYRKG